MCVYGGLSSQGANPLTIVYHSEALIVPYFFRLCFRLEYNKQTHANIMHDFIFCVASFMHCKGLCDHFATRAVAFRPTHWLMNEPE